MIAPILFAILQNLVRIMRGFGLKVVVARAAMKLATGLERIEPHLLTA